MLLFWKDWAQRYNWTGEIKKVSVVLVGLSDRKWEHMPLYFSLPVSFTAFWKTRLQRQAVCLGFPFYFIPSQTHSLSLFLFSILCLYLPLLLFFLLDFTICCKFFFSFVALAPANPKLNNMHLFIRAFLYALMRLRIVLDNKHGLVWHRLLAKPHKAVYCRSLPANSTSLEDTSYIH